MAGALTPKQRRFVAAYEGPGSGIAAARAAGYKGSDKDLSARASKLLQLPKIRAAVEARGVALPPLRGTEAEAPPAGPVADYTPPDDPNEFWLAAQRGEFKPTTAQIKAAERREQMQRRAAPSTDAESRLEALRAKTSDVIKAKLAARQTPGGLAAELNGIALSVRPLRLRRHVLVAVKALNKMVSEKKRGKPT